MSFYQHNLDCQRHFFPRWLIHSRQNTNPGVSLRSSICWASHIYNFQSIHYTRSQHYYNFWLESWFIRQRGSTMMLDLIDVIRPCNFAASPCAKAEQYVYAAATTGTSGRFFITSDMATARPCWLFTSQKNTHSGDAKYPARLLHTAASFTSRRRRCGYISLESHKLWNVRIPCILIECGTLNGCGNSATWRRIPPCAVSRVEPMSLN